MISFTKQRTFTITWVLFGIFLILSPFFQGILFQKKLTDPEITAFNQEFKEVFNNEHYTYKIDRRLAFDQVGESPFYTVSYNYNRFIHNKFFYQLDVLMSKIVSIFDFERIISPMIQPFSGSGSYFPLLFFFQVPLIFLGFVFSQLKKDLWAVIFISVGILGQIIFGQHIIYLLLFLIGLIFFQTQGYVGLLKLIPKSYKKLFIVLSTIVFVAGQLTLVGLLMKL